MPIVGFYKWSVVISVSFLTPPAPLSKGGARQEKSDRTFFPYPYFISYRQLEQRVAACCTLIRACRDGDALKLVWSAIEREAARYTEEAFN
jgi:hypothetical protein